MYISKDLIRRTIAVAFAMAIYFAFLSALAQAEIKAPKGCNAGELVVAQSDEPATWTVFPNQYKTAIYVANEGRTCVFASPEKGEVTLIAATIVDDKVVLDQFTLYNGVPIPEDETVDPKPAPEPVPEPEPEPETFESIIKNTKVDATEADYNAVAESFETAVSGIERGTITTPAGARETFRATLALKAGQVNPAILTAFKPLLDVISAKVNNDSLEGIKEDYSAIAKALRAVKPPAGQNPCPNGNCPKQQPTVIRGGLFR